MRVLKRNPEKKVFGPEDSDKVQSIIGHRVLYSTHEKGEKLFGVLESIDSGDVFPYIVVTGTGVKVRANYVRKIRILGEE